MSKNMTHINGISGEVFDIKNFDPSQHFCLNSVGQETLLTTKEESALFIFPKSLINNEESKFFKLTSSSTSSKAKLLSKSSQEIFSVSPNEDKIEEVKAIKLKENMFIKSFVEKTKKHFTTADSCSNEFSNQCKSLVALSRHVKVVMLDNFKEFVSKSSSAFADFAEKKTSLVKNSEKIYTDLVIKDINDSITNVKVKSLFDFVLRDENALGESILDERTFVSNHFEKISEFHEKGTINLRGWKQIFQALEKRMLKISNSDSFVQFTTSRSQSSKYDEFKVYKENILKYFEKTKSIYENHCSHLNQLKKILKMDMYAITLLNEMNGCGYLEEVNGLDEKIIEDLFKCIQHKYKMNEKLFEYFNYLITSRANIVAIVNGSGKHFIELTNNLLQRSMRILLFAQNLPDVYEDSINELLRRKQFTGDLKKQIIKINMLFTEKSRVENKSRKKFQKKAENLLGRKIPTGLVRGIYDDLIIPEVDLSILDKNAPNIADISEALDRFENEYVLIDAEDGLEGPDKNAEKKLDPDMLTTVFEKNALKSERERAKDLNDLYYREMMEREKKNKKMINKKKNETKVKEKENPDKKTIRELKIALENIQKDMTRMRQVNEFLKKDKTQEVEKLNSEKKSELLLKENETKILQNEKEDLRKINEDLKNQLREKIMSTGKVTHEKSSEIEKLKIELKKAWSELENAQKSLLIENEKIKSLTKKKQLEGLNVKKKENELKKKVQDGLNIIKKQTSELRNLKEFVEPMLKSNDKYAKEISKLKESLSKSSVIIQEQKEKGKKNEKIILKIQSDLKKMEKKKNDFANVIGKQSRVIEEQRQLINELKKSKKKNTKNLMKYEKELQSLFEMGFKDKELCTHILYKHKGDLEKCLTHLMRQNSSTTKLRSNKKHFVAFDFALNDRVIFFKKNNKIWEIYSWKPLQKRYLLSNYALSSLKNSSTTCCGSIIEMDDIEWKKRDPLKLKENYVSVLISIEEEM